MGEGKLVYWWNIVFVSVNEEWFLEGLSVIKESIQF